MATISAVRPRALCDFDTRPSCPHSGGPKGPERPSSLNQAYRECGCLVCLTALHGLDAEQIIVETFEGERIIDRAKQIGGTTGSVPRGDSILRIGLFLHVV
jgi:hypothetical protein